MLSKVNFLRAVLIIFLLVGIVLHYRQVSPHQAEDLSLPSVEQFRAMNYQAQLDLVKKSAESDPIATWAYVKSVFLINGQQVGNAHQFAHLVGNGMFSKYGLDGITNCDEAIAFGCYHGVSQKLLEQKGTTVIKEIQDRCTQIFPPDKSSNYTGCIHGMGHGLLTWERYQVGKALLDCDILDQPYQNYCYDGVFMEHTMELAAGEFDPNHPWKFCSDLDAKYHFNCARYQSQIFLSQLGGDISKAGTDCAASADETLSTTCFESLGYYVTQMNTGKLPQILKSCGLIDGNGSRYCIIGAAREVSFQAYVGWEETATALCESLPADWKSKCSVGNPLTRPPM